MFTKIAVTSLLAGAAVAVPHPPSVAEKGTSSPVNFAHKITNGGNFMPNHVGDFKNLPSRTIPQPPSAVQGLQRRATGEWVQIAADANWDSANIYDGVGDGVDEYTLYLGDGSTGEGWPAQSSWVSFDNMFNNYKDTMFAACGNENPPVADDSGPEVGAIWDGIQMAAQATGVDHRFILAVIMQESSGCVRVPTTNYGVSNPGLMQDHDGAGTCNQDGDVQNPCPSATIYEMISEGTAGTDSGDGLANCINESGLGTVADFYRAARIYNSGSIDSSGNLQAGIATHCYSSDIANRLTGWVNAASQCTCDSDPSSCGI